jgi:hypothetical protein
VKYINDCPIKRSIPVYLLVGGCSGILRILATLWRNIRYRRQLDSYNDSYIHEDLYVSQTYRLMNVTLTLFLIGWLIAGSHWTFSVWEPPFSQPLHEPSNWCERTVYKFAVYQITGSYVFLSLVLLVSCGLTIYHKACSWNWFNLFSFLEICYWLLCAINVSSWLRFVNILDIAVCNNSVRTPFLSRVSPYNAIIIKSSD